MVRALGAASFLRGMVDGAQGLGWAALIALALSTTSGLLAKKRLRPTAGLRGEIPGRGLALATHCAGA
ncbi:hypothetical protein ACK3BK_12400 [Pseudomonas sp. L7]|uniref:hypothetical protein n=1 Tax=Pseudomonas sp. L7 TaxID=3388343 RepID=UPI0039850DA9